MGSLKHRYAIKTATISEDETLAKEVRILNRTVKWHPGEGVAVEADPRHVEIAIVDTGAGNAKTLSIYRREGRIQSRLERTRMIPRGAAEFRQSISL